MSTTHPSTDPLRVCDYDGALVADAGRFGFLSQ